MSIERSVRTVGRLTTIGLAFVALAVVPSIARAQQPVSEILSFLLTNQSIPTADFTKDAEAAEATRDAIATALLIELTTLPISASSGGFTYQFNPALGTVERTSDTFGAFFLERALTSGPNQLSLGMSYRYSRFTNLDDNDLRDGTFVTTANQFRDEGAPFDVETLALRLETSTVTIFGNYGVTDRLDLAVALPIVAMKLEGERINVYRGQSFLQSSASATITGIADVAVRAKVRLSGDRGTGVAVGSELRLPTGAEEDLLGAGEMTLKGLVIGSIEAPRVAAHFNAGYTVGGIVDELSYGAAITGAAAPRLTVVGEFIGRRINGLGRIAQVTAPHPLIQGVDTLRLEPEGRTSYTAFAVGGVKWNVASTWLLNVNALIPLTSGGLRATVVPSVTLDYAFGR